MADSQSPQPGDVAWFPVLVEMSSGAATIQFSPVVLSM